MLLLYCIVARMFILQSLLWMCVCVRVKQQEISRSIAVTATAAVAAKTFPF